MNHHQIKIWTVIVVAVFFVQLYSQKIVINTSSVWQNYLDYLITSGKYYTPDIFLQPYLLEEDEMKNFQDRAGNYLNNVSKLYFVEDRIKFRIILQDNGKLDGELFNRYRGDIFAGYMDKNIIIANQTSIDQNYKYDSNFSGDLSEADHWLYGRVNDAYLYAFTERWQFFIGRQHRNWGIPGEKSLILSDNPYTYDHGLITYRANNFTLSLIFAQLDEGRFGTFENPDSLIDAKRFLVGHRLDYSFTPHFQIGLSEFALYGGPDRSPELSLLNPLNLYYPVQRNDKKQLNGLWALDLFYKPSRKTAIYGQFLIDDIIVNNDPGVDDRGRYPDRLGVQIIFKKADWLQRGTHWVIGYTRIWNRTYQSKYGWENYHYRNYSLGYPDVSLEEFKLKVESWHFFPFYISNETIIGRYGDADVTDIFLLQKENFPIPPVTKNFINQLCINYFHSVNTVALLKIFYRENVTHYSNRYSDRNKWVINFGLNINFGI